MTVPFQEGRLVIQQRRQVQNDAEDFIRSHLKDLPNPFDFERDLRDGVLLCKLMNKLVPGSIGMMSLTSEPFRQMENISLFLHACATMDMKPHDMFQTLDLYEGKTYTKLRIAYCAWRKRCQQYC
ncbi:calponin homology domain-containing protein [Chytridium lagenaria]|nr:calponin homology domain-containing protein [Chytridium lagenaria]